jgi:hypothetical protein
MRIALVALLAALGLTACADFDQYVPREYQCVALDAAKAAAAQRGIDVDTYVNTEGLFVCADLATD